MKVFAIVVTYNPMKWIDKCLGSLKQSSSFVQTIVVDNNSTDGSIDYIKKKYPEVYLFANNTNLGFGVANNIGIKKAYEDGADYFFLLNQDAWIEPNTIGELIEAHKKEPEFGIVSPMHLNGKGNALDYNFSNYLAPRNCVSFYSDMTLQKPKKKLYELSFVNAAAWLISKNCIEIVGGFNPSFFHYGEDYNYVQRIKFFNFKLGVLVNSRIYHDRETRAKSRYFDEYLLFEREFTLKVSNPYSKYNFSKEYKKEYKNLLKSIVLLRLGKIRVILLKIKILKNLDKKNILINRTKSIKEKFAFIN